MAALPYIQFYVADYLADTIHLNTEQHGAYVLLIFHYWQTGKPIKNDEKILQNITKLSKVRWKKNSEILTDFFDLVDGCLVHERIETDLSGVKTKVNQKVKASRAAKAARSAKQSTPSNDSPSDSPPDAPNDTPIRSEQIRSDTDQSRESRGEAAPPAPPEKAQNPFGEANPDLVVMYLAARRSRNLSNPDINSSPSLLKTQRLLAGLTPDEATQTLENYLSTSHKDIQRSHLPDKPRNNPDEPTGYLSRIAAGLDPAPVFEESQ